MILVRKLMAFDNNRLLFAMHAWGNKIAAGWYFLAADLLFDLLFCLTICLSNHHNY